MFSVSHDGTEDKDNDEEHTRAYFKISAAFFCVVTTLLQFVDVALWRRCSDDDYVWSRTYLIHHLHPVHVFHMLDLPLLRLQLFSTLWTLRRVILWLWGLLHHHRLLAIWLLLLHHGLLRRCHHWLRLLHHLLGLHSLPHRKVLVIYRRLIRIDNPIPIQIRRM